MKIRFLTWLLCALVAATAPTAPAAGSYGVNEYPPSCPTGTNWDSILQRCV